MKKILQRESTILREISVEVPVAEINSPKIKKIIQELREAMHSQDDSVAIAAPQIGYNLRIFIVSRKVQIITKKKLPEEDKETEDLSKYKDTIFINPVIRKISREKKYVEEGCLSVRYLYGKVLRSNKATVEAYDEHGKKFTKPGAGLWAQIFQHEIDHLDGVLFLDKAKDLEEIPPEEVNKNEKKN